MLCPRRMLCFRTICSYDPEPGGSPMPCGSEISVIPIYLASALDTDKQGFSGGSFNRQFAILQFPKLGSGSHTR
jgi:hypothetical protein